MNPGEQPKWGPADPTGGPVLGMPANPTTGDIDQVSASGDYEAWDDVKDKPLDASEVAKARGVEMQYVKHHGVYEYAIVEECRRETGAEPIKTKWLDANKGDDASPMYRSRWVAQQYRCVG